MTTTQSSTSTGSFGFVAVVAMGLGALIALYGVQMLPLSLLRGVHIVAVGITFLTPARL